MLVIGKHSDPDYEETVIKAKVKMNIYFFLELNLQKS